MTEKLEEYADVGAEVAKGTEAARSTLDVCSFIHSDLTDRLQVLYKKQKQIRDRMDKLRPAVPKPAEPAYQPLEDLHYVLPIKRPEAIDENTGKKKAQMPGADLKVIMDAIAQGEWDGKEVEFGEFTLSSSQYSQIKRAVDARNNHLDQERLSEKNNREKTLVEFAALIADWETDERRRKAAFELTKKESRKHNLIISCVNERAEFIASQMDTLERDLDAWEGLKSQDEQARDRFQVIRAKQELERNRILQAIQILKSRLLAILVARRRALAYPGGAKNELQFLRMKERAEISLRTLRYEVIDCKSKLQIEGVRLRQIQDEEESTLKGELYRLKLLKEAMKQRQAIDTILERHKTEVIYLMEDIEKIKVIEAEHDDRGLSYTVDDLGEEYLPDKVWENPVINTTARTIELLRAKIALTDKLRETAVFSQMYIQEAIGVKWSPDFISVRDSWAENSDYDRAQHLMEELSRWIHSQRNKLARKEQEIMGSNTESFLEVNAVRAVSAANLECHDHETEIITESASKAIELINKRLEENHQTTKARFTVLENSITELSRELHTLREERSRQTLMYEGKMQTLIAFIQTLQSTLEHLYIQLNTLREENKKITMKASLDSERLRFQLRAERTHSANIMFIIHMQRSSIRLLQGNIETLHKRILETEMKSKEERRQLRREIWEHVFAFSKLGVDVEALFEFFTLRLANLAGSRKEVNDSFRENGAALVLAALCKSPRPLIRKNAARALAGMGWNGFVEPRIIMWDCVSYWKAFKSNVLSAENSSFQKPKERFMDSGKFETILELDNELEPYVPPSGMSKRSLVRQRRQWALRATRRLEGPNEENQTLLNMKSGIIPSLLEICEQDGAIDWEIVRNASLALSVASYAEQNRLDMAADERCIRLLVSICSQEDPEIRTHVAVTIANLVHHNETAQRIFGEAGVIKALLSMCSVHIPDVLEAATSALSNLTSFSDENCRIVLEGNGISLVAGLLTVSCTENLLDFDQNEEVQANAAEVLTNVSRYNCDLTVRQFSADVIDALIIACSSPNLQVKRHVPLVLGNIAQNEYCRSDVGDRGGVEALFLALEDDDKSVQANTLWALSNLMWHSPNQTRAGLYLSEILEQTKSDFLPIKTHACILLANVLYFNNQNRVKFLEMEGALEQLIEEIRKKDDEAITESCLRAMLSLSYMDAAALWLGGSTGNCIPLFISFTRVPFYTRECMKQSIEILLNLCVHHDNRRNILEAGGIEALIYLLGDEEVVRDTALRILNHLEDVTPPEVLAKVKTDIGLARMVRLTTHEDQLVRAVAAESIGEEVWRDSKKQSIVNNLGGVQTLLAICANKNEQLEARLPALWSLRNVMHDNVEGQAQFHTSNGVTVIVTLLRSCLAGECKEQSEKVLEGCLACLFTAIYNHERNARSLIRHGLDLLIDLADAIVPSPFVDEDPSDYVVKAVQSEGCVAIAKSILQMLGPYNYVVCRNCQKKQDLNGTHCVACGYKLVVEISQTMNSPLKSTTTSNNVLMNQSTGMLPTTSSGNRNNLKTSSSQSSTLRAAGSAALSNSRSGSGGYRSLSKTDSSTPKKSNGNADSKI